MAHTVRGDNNINRFIILVLIFVNAFLSKGFSRVIGRIVEI